MQPGRPNARHCATTRAELQGLTRTARRHVPVGTLPPGRGLTRDALEHGREMRLGLKTDAQRNFGQRHAHAGQRGLRALDPLLEQVFVRAAPRRRPELRRKVHARQPCGGSKVGQGQGIADAGVHMLLDTPQPPLCQGADPGRRWPERQQPLSRWSARRFPRSASLPCSARRRCWCARSASARAVPRGRRGS